MRMSMGRPAGRLFFCWFVLVVALLGGAVPARAVTAKTLIQDVLYYADGTPAKGTLLISWPAFATADGQAVAAGSLTVSVGVDGVVNFSLYPNMGSTPQGTYYTVVLDLDRGRSTEYWTVPQLAQTQVAAIRSKLVPRSQAVQYSDPNKEPIPASAVSGNFASFDGNRYVVDSGKKPADFAAVNAATIVNGASCALGASCTVYDSTKVPTSLVPAVAPAAGQLLLGNASGTAYAPQTLSGDCTLSSSGAATCSKTNGSPFGPAATRAAQGTSCGTGGQSRLSREANNYFGIKALARYDRIAMPTFEVEGGVRKAVTAWFARFPSMMECFLARDRLITSGALFAEARAAKADAEQFTRALARHWATDPAYADKILAIYRRFQLNSIAPASQVTTEIPVSQGD